MPSMRGAVALGLCLSLPAALHAETRAVPSDAFPTIQSAVDAALPGDVVNVGAGVFHENVVISTAFVELRGKGTIDGGYAGPCLDVQADFVVVTGLTLVNGSVGLRADASATLVTRTRVRGAAGAGLELTGGPFFLGRLDVSGCAAEGILITATTSVTSDPSLLAKNVVQGCGTDGVRLVGDQDSAFELEGNRCLRNGRDGISVGYQGGLGVVRLVRNLAADNARHGIFVESDRNVLCERNRCNGNAGDGIAGGTRIATDANSCDGNIGSGIDIRSAGQSHERNRCRGNGRHGQRYVFGEEVGVNAVREGLSKDNGRDGLRFETLAEGDILSVSGCRSQGNGGDGLDVGAGFGSVTLAGNTCRSNDHEGIDSSGAGVTIHDNTALHNVGVDIAGAGKGGVGEVLAFEGNHFGTGGPEQAQALEL